MAANPTKTYEVDVEDVEYVRHGDKPLLARMFKPRGQGPFPSSNYTAAHGASATA
jgi:hypothetical protein